jgi:hypothetical protein
MTRPVVAMATSASDLAATLETFMPDAVTSGWAALIGALVGALLAFLLQRVVSQTRVDNPALMSANRTLFALVQQINTLVVIQRDHVHPRIDDPCRFVSIPATPAYDNGKYLLATNDMSFLTRTAAGRAVLREIQTAQEHYVAALDQWNLRSLLHLRHVQPARDSAGISSVAAVSQQALEKALGSAHFGSLVDATDNCLAALRRAFEALAGVKTQVRALAVKHFGMNEFTDFDFPENYGLAAGDKPRSL